MLQLQCLIFCMAFGMHDATAVDAFHEYGTYGKNDSKTFHKTGAAMRIVVALLTLDMLRFCFENIWVVIGGFICCCIMLWLSFNISLNLSRRSLKTPWYYSGQTSVIDRMFDDYKLVTYAGAAIVVSLNVLLSFLV